MNIYNYLIRNSIKFRKKNALILNEEKISYSNLINIVDYYSEEFFRKYNLRPNSKITVLMENSIEYVLLILIACKLNITVQTLGIYYSKKLINYRINKFKPKIIFTKKYFNYYFNSNLKNIKFFEHDKNLNKKKK